jgi:RNA polymerase sigma-70 factor (ECF subfamily)
MEFTGQIAFPRLTVAATDSAASRDDRFAELVARQSRFVFQVAYSVLRNVHDAEDVVQDTFLKLHRSGAWENLDNERGFLATAAWRLAVDRTRRPKMVAEVERSVPSHEGSLISGDMHATLHRLIDGLPEEFRLPLALSAIDEMTSPQIAEMLQIPEGTVRSRIARARTMLKERLAAHLEKRHV